MMKAIECLVHGGIGCGNHTAIHTDKESRYFYHGNLVCAVDKENCSFTLHTYRKYQKSRSTGRTLNDYQSYFEALGYRFEGKVVHDDSELR